MTTKARELLEHGLKDMYDAEHRFTKALGTMIDNAHDRSLVDGFRRHRDVTKNQVKRLEQAFEEIGSRPSREECPAAKGLVREYEKFVEEEGAADGLHDTFAATAGLKVEHYEIASYRALIDLAEFCDYGGAARLTKLSGELAGASTADIAQRTLGSMVDQAREGTLHAVGGVRAVGERAIGEARKVVRKAEKRGRVKLQRGGTTTRRATSTVKRKASTTKRKATRKATTSRARATSKATRGTRNASRPRAKSSTARSRTTAARKTTSRPASRKTTARRRSTARRASR
jgi:ferritin-like metal-binding protein YciE